MGEGKVWTENKRFSDGTTELLKTQIRMRHERWFPSRGAALALVATGGLTLHAERALACDSNVQCQAPQVCSNNACVPPPAESPPHDARAAGSVNDTVEAPTAHSRVVVPVQARHCRAASRAPLSSGASPRQEENSGNGTMTRQEFARDLQAPMACRSDGDCPTGFCADDATQEAASADQLRVVKPIGAREAVAQSVAFFFDPGLLVAGGFFGFAGRGIAAATQNAGVEFSSPVGSGNLRWHLKVAYSQLELLGGTGSAGAFVPSWEGPGWTFPTNRGFNGARVDAFVFGWAFPLFRAGEARFRIEAETSPLYVSGSYLGPGTASENTEFGGHGPPNLMMLYGSEWGASLTVDWRRLHLVLRPLNVDLPWGGGLYAADGHSLPGGFGFNLMYRFGVDLGYNLGDGA